MLKAHGSSPKFQLRTPHAVPAVVAEVAVAVPHGDGAAVIATGGIQLEAGELFLAGHGPGILIDVHCRAGTMQ